MSIKIGAEEMEVVTFVGTWWVDGIGAEAFRSRFMEMTNTSTATEKGFWVGEPGGNQNTQGRFFLCL